MAKYTLNDLIIETLELCKIPMTPEEIWENALVHNFPNKLDSYGKTPWASIGAKIYTDMKNNKESSSYIQVSKRPTRFLTKSIFNTKSTKELDIVVEKQIEKESKPDKTSFHERDLHPLLVRYVINDSHFNCHTKTILHENSSKKIKGMNEWLHPDLVGVYFPFSDYSPETRSLQKSLSVSSIRLFAFEMKIQLNFSNLRQSFFQAVSNSSWANEGFLVCLKLDDDPDFKNELQRLTNSFGIGIIQINCEVIEESRVVYPARFKDNIDWDTINRLSEDSPDFKKFISDLNEDVQVEKVKSSYDKILDDEDIDKHINDKKIKI